MKVFGCMRNNKVDKNNRKFLSAHVSETNHTLERVNQFSSNPLRLYSINNLTDRAFFFQIICIRLKFGTIFTPPEKNVISSSRSREITDISLNR